MAISCTCSNCGRQFSNIKDELAGKKVRCSCGTKIRLPEPKPVDRNPRGNAEPAAGPPGISPRPAQAPSRGLIDWDYGDLDAILARKDAPDEVLNPSPAFQQRLAVPPASSAVRTQVESDQQPREQSRQLSTAASLQASGLPAASSLASSAARPSTDRSTASKGRSPDQAGLWFLLTLLTALLAGWVGGVLLLARWFKSLQNPVLDWLILPLGQIYSGNFGTTEISPLLKNGFVFSGWLILLLAGLLIITAIGLVGNAISQLFSRKLLFRQSDGWLATLAVLLLFLLVGNLFLHKTHMGELQREIKLLTANLGSDEVPPQFSRLQQGYQLQEQTFQVRVLTLAGLPLLLFSVAMLRLVLRESCV
jgi:DNA-directed RNA polymerase subunit RPC12/RpoP